MGNAIEWYEYTSYSLVETEIAINFFQGNKVAGWVGFGLTFVFRPLGGLCFGYMADYTGRKPALLTALWMMLGATVAQGFMPQIPHVGTAGILLCRALQGFATGGVPATRGLPRRAVLHTRMHRRPQSSWACISHGTWTLGLILGPVHKPQPTPNPTPNPNPNQD